MKNSTKHILAFLLSTLYMVIVYFAIGICFSINDDRFMGEVFSGAITGKIESNVVFVNYFLSFPISLLYRISTSVSWFGIILVAFHYLTCFCMIDSFLMKAKSKAEIIVSIILSLLLLSVNLYLIAQITFTITAAFMAIGGYVCLILRENKKEGLLYFALLELLALFLREMAMIMIQPLGLVVFGGYLLFQKNVAFKAKFIHVIKVLGILAIALFISFMGKKIAFHSEEWQTYDEYNVVRSELYDYAAFPPYEDVKHILDKYDVSENAYLAYQNYIVLDSDISLDCAKELAEYMSNMPKGTVTLPYLLQKLYTATFHELYWQVHLVVLCAYICTILFCLFAKNFGSLLPTALLLLTRTAIWLYLLYGGRFPRRLSMPLFAAELFLLGALVFAAYCEHKPYKKWQKISLIAVGVFFLLPTLWSVKIQSVSFREVTSAQAFYMESYKELLNYCNQNADKRYILDTASCNYYYGVALDGSIYGNRNCITLGSWLSLAPSMENRSDDYLASTDNGFYYILLATKEDISDELTSPSVLYLEEATNTTATLSDTLTVSHGGTYLVLYFR